MKVDFVFAIYVFIYLGFPRFCKMYFSDIIICILPATPLYLLTYSFPFVRYVWRRTIEAGECFVIGRSFILRWTLLGCVLNTNSFFSSIFLILLFTQHFLPSNIVGLHTKKKKTKATVTVSHKALALLAAPLLIFAIFRGTEMLASSALHLPQVHFSILIQL